MKHLILVAALAMGSTAFASELDNESSVTNQAMNGTVVIRVDTRNNQTAVVASDKVMASKAQAQELARGGQFKALSSEKVRTELDQDGGASSWYFYRGYNYAYSSVYWYGNWYNPYYTYNYNYYTYYYYSNYWW